MTRPKERAAICLEVEALTKTFDHTQGPVQVLQGVSFRLQGGDSMAITGPSGAGKSTLLHLIGTLDHPSSGHIRIGESDPFALPEAELARFRNQTIGFVFQDHYLLPQYTALENALLPTAAFKGNNGSAQDRALELMERVGLAQRCNHRPAELSGGERQRAALARALVNRPALLLCDEPTGNLDRDNAASIADLLLEMHRSEGNILIVVTHSGELVQRFGRHLELRDGVCLPA